MPVTIHPDLLEATTRLTELERETDRAREQCRALLHQLTDIRIAVDSTVIALRDFDSSRVEGGEQ